MYDFQINENGILFIKAFTRKIRKDFFIIFPLALFLLGIVVYINFLTLVGGMRHYLPGAFLGTMLGIVIFVIPGMKFLSIIKHTITKITITDETVSFICAQGLRQTNYNFECTLDNFDTSQELNPKKVFKDEKIFVFKLDNKDKLYFAPSLWDNYEEIIQLLKPKNE